METLIYIFFDTSGFAYTRFVDILETFDSVQHIDKPTHNRGHLLDYIITRKDSSGVSNLYVSDFVSDHRDLHVSLTCSRAHPERKQIEVRSLKRIQCDVLEADLIGVNIDRECIDVQNFFFKIVDTLLGRNKHTTLLKYDSPITMASVMNNFFIDNSRAEFPLLEANLPCYSFLSMDSIMPMCTTTLNHFDSVTDSELLKIISGMNNTTCSSDPFPTRLLMSHLYAIVSILQHIVNLCLTTGDFINTFD